LEILLQRLFEKLNGKEEALSATATLIRDELFELMNQPGLMKELSANAVRMLNRASRRESTFHPTPQIPGGD
jgi:hypothetical protein